VCFFVVVDAFEGRMAERVKNRVGCVAVFLEWDSTGLDVANPCPHWLVCRWNISSYLRQRYYPCIILSS